MLASCVFINCICVNAKQGSRVIFCTFWICWCSDDPRTQKLLQSSVPACAGVIQTGDLIPAGEANRRASENKH